MTMGSKSLEQVFLELTTQAGGSVIEEHTEEEHIAGEDTAEEQTAREKVVKEHTAEKNIRLNRTPVYIFMIFIFIPSTWPKLQRLVPPSPCQTSLATPL